MTALAPVLRFILGNRVTRGIGAVLVAILGFVTFGLVQRRKGALAAAEKAAKRNAKMQKEINDALDASHAGGAVWSDRLRQHIAERDS